MLTADELLKDGEELLGDYNIEIARWINEGWFPTMPPLYAILSDHRIILQPHARKRHEPAIIPTSYIVRVREIQSGYRRGILLELKTGHKIGMFVSGDPRQQMIPKIKEAILPHNQEKRKYKIELDLGSIQKMINFFTEA